MSALRVDLAEVGGQSTYLGIDGGELVDLARAGPVPALARVAHDSFSGLVSSPAFVCVGAKAAISRGTYRFGLFGDLGADDSAAGLADGLARFQRDRARAGNDFFSYIAFFTGHSAFTEDEFEAALWRQLDSLNRFDQAEWDPAVSSDPSAPSFSFSFGGHAYFIVGMHAGSSRWSRRFAWPTLVFNPHDQFDELRADGRMPKWQEVIREADIALQGSANPNLSDFGELPEARQYSGKRNPPGWRCPFHARQP